LFIRPGGDAVLDKQTNVGPGGICIGRDNSGTATTNIAASNKLKEFAALLKPLLDAIQATKLSDAQKSALEGQIGVLREEASKRAEDRDPGFIRATFENIKAAVGAAKVASDVLDAFSRLFG
jgi:hypothetical protein